MDHPREIDLRDHVIRSRTVLVEAEIVLNELHDHQNELSWQLAGRPVQWSAGVGQIVL